MNVVPNGCALAGHAPNSNAAVATQFNAFRHVMAIKFIRSFIQIDPANKAPARNERLVTR
jgi:hypothetical protein